MLRKSYRVRIHLLLLIPVVALACLVPRLYYLQVVKHEHYVALADTQHKKTVEIMPCRGKILDRNYHELAGSRLMQSAYVVPRHIKSEHAASFANAISRVVDIPYDAIHKRLTGTSEVPLARKLTPQQVAALKDVKLQFRKDVPMSSIYFVEEGKREYARSDLAPHVVGYVTLDDTGDNTGLAGIELFYNEELRGKKERARVRTNAVQLAMEPTDHEQMYSTYGNTVVLTIDDTIQYAAQSALVKAVSQEHQADSGIAVVMHVKTGEILAMATVPSFDLTDRRAPDNVRRNRVITDSIEPGSVMKILTYAAAIEEQRLQVGDIINCNGGRWAVHGRVVTDTHLGTGAVTAMRAFATSSNVGAVKAGLLLTPATFHERLVRFGLGQPTGIDLPGETDGLLRNVRNWTAQSMSSIPMGYELRVTGLQMVAAVSAIANKGIYMQPHVVREIRDFRGDTVTRVQPRAVRRVCSSLTSQKMLQMMEEVVVNGTGKLAAVPNYRVGGKTGTTRKIDPLTRTYGRSYFGSFCGVAPLEDPEICVYIWMDNPRGGSIYGGTIAAPVFREIAEVALKTLKVPMQREADPSMNVSLTLDTLRQELTGRVPATYLSASRPADTVTSGTMPNLEGRTMREVTEMLAEARIPFEFVGSGVVVDQYPRPYVTLEEGGKAQITFGSRQEYLAKLVVDAQRAEVAKGEAGFTTVTEQMDGGLVLVKGDTSLPVRLSATRQSPLRAATLPRPADAAVAPAAAGSAEAEADPAVERPVNKAVAKDAWAQWKKEREKAASEARKAAEAPALGDSGEAVAAAANESGPSAPTSAYDLEPRQRGSNRR